MIYTVDVNIFVADVIPTEIHHADSRALLDALRRDAATIYCPTLILAEASAAIARPTGDIPLAQSMIRQIARFSGMQLVNLTRIRARRAAQLAAEHRLRGADAIYVAVAVEFGATLITWDAEMLTRGASAVTTFTPSQWLLSASSAP